MAAANDGDPAAFDALYLRYRDWVLRLAWRFTHDREESLDVLQETFLYLLHRFPGFELTARMTTFLYPVVRSIAVTHHRKRARQADSDAYHIDDYLHDQPEKADPEPLRLSSRQLDALLSPLSDDQREIILMRFVDDMTPSEIAQALNIPAGTAKSRLHGAIRRLHDDPETRRYFEQ